MCRAIDSATAFLTYELIRGAEAADCLMSLEQLQVLDAGDLYSGRDVARTHDMSVFWLFQKLGDVKYTRLIEVFEKTEFAVQEDFLERLMRLPRMRRICIDKSGMGMPLVEHAQKTFGEYLVEGVTFTGKIKEEMAFDAKNALEDLGTSARSPQA